MAILLSLSIAWGCASSTSVTERSGPDASVAVLPQSSVDEYWPSSNLRTVIIRPTFDESTSGVLTRDSRTTLAILDPERATWILSARLTDRQGLDLTNQIQQLIVRDSLLEDRTHSLKVHLLRQPDDGSTSMAIPEGQWRLLTTETSASEGIIRIGVVESGTETLVGEAAMDPVTARDLIHRLAAAIRSPDS